MKYQHFWLPNQEIAYSTNAISSKVDTKKFLQKSIEKWTSGALRPATASKAICSIRFKSLEPLKHSYFDENAPETNDLFENVEQKKSGICYIHKKWCWFWFWYSYIWFIAYSTSYFLYFFRFSFFWPTFGGPIFLIYIYIYI